MGFVSRIDQNELAKSQATLVYGQMNEPPGARASVALSGLTVAEEFVIMEVKMASRRILCSLLIISFVLLRLVLRCQLYLVECHQL
jgi:hypothetical protein